MAARKFFNSIETMSDETFRHFLRMAHIDPIDAVPGYLTCLANEAQRRGIKYVVIARRKEYGGPRYECGTPKKVRYAAGDFKTHGTPKRRGSK